MTTTAFARVLVVGLAETGVAVARALRAEGAAVSVIEDAPPNTATYAERARITRACGAEVVERPDGARLRALVADVDLVVPSPLVRPGHPTLVIARERGIAVRSEIDVAAERAGAPIVAVTGTNGKTTVTTMVAAMLTASGVPAVAAGNLGRPLIDAIADDEVKRPGAVIVAEVSSFQLEFAQASFRPRVAVLLAITPDHIDWHGSFDDYAAAKARITAYQSAGDLLVFDADDEHATAIAAARSGPPGRRVGPGRSGRVLPGRRRRPRLPRRPRARAGFGDGARARA